MQHGVARARASARRRRRATCAAGGAARHARCVARRAGGNARRRARNERGDDSVVRVDRVRAGRRCARDVCRVAEDQYHGSNREGMWRETYTGRRTVGRTPARGTGS